MSRPAVFLDRDGTIIEEANYLRSIARMRLLPRSAAAIRMLNDAGFAVVVITNQAGVARGYFDEPHVDATHAALSAALAHDGARIDAYYFCPHHPKFGSPAYRQVCECRKPAPGMLRRAAAEHDLDLARSWMVGDRWLDVEAGAAAGARTILVRTGDGSLSAETPRADVVVDAILNDLMEAAEWILRSSSRS